MNIKKYTMASLFSGIGGIDLGFEQVGIKTIWANDIDSHATVTYKTNHPETELILNDIKNISGYDIPKIDILSGGFPCQAFSVAGNQKGFEDERGQLFFEIIRIIKEMTQNNNRPKIIFLENVKNLKNHDNKQTYETIVNKLEKELKYTVVEKVLNTSEYGNIPQNRERIYIIAFENESLAKRFHWPERLELTNKFNDIIDRNKTQNPKYYYTDRVKAYQLLKKEVTDPTKVYQYRRIYVRENKSGLCPTLTASMGTGGHNVPIILDNNKKIRKLTPKECLLLQGFPPDFVLPPDISDSLLYKQIGNSVSVPVISRIASILIKILNDD